MSTGEGNGKKEKRGRAIVPRRVETLPPYITTLREFENFFDRFRRTFDERMSSLVPLSIFPYPSLWELPVRSPLVDIADHGKYYAVTADLPGLTKDEVNVEVNGFRMQIRANMKREKSEEKENFIRRERAYAAFERSVSFPEEVLPSKVSGTMKNGVLELRIPKKVEMKEKKAVKVEIE